MIDFSNFSIFIGRFHPLIVHLPIGFLFMLFIIELAEKFRVVTSNKNVAKLILISSGISGIIACILGLFLGSGESDYDVQSIQLHQWIGIITTVVIFISYYLKDKDLKLYDSSLILLFILLGLTGHMGGNLTHGSTYLTQYSPIQFHQEKSEFDRPEITSLEDVQVFGDLVYPILETKCISCHNEEKKKGNLSLTSVKGILKGGKNGAFIIAGNTSKSSFLQRISLPHHHEEIMPPEGKKPLSDDDIAIITFWIEHGLADFDTLLLSIEKSEMIFANIEQRLGLTSQVEYAFDPIKPSVLQDLASSNFHYREIINESNAYDIAFHEKVKLEKHLPLLKAIQNNIIWLDLKGQNLDKEFLTLIRDCSNLERINLSNTNINDDNLDYLLSLEKLKVINLHSTEISDTGLEKLQQLPLLEKVYSWNTNVGKKYATLNN